MKTGGHCDNVSKDQRDDEEIKLFPSDQVANGASTFFESCCWEFAPLPDAKAVKEHACAV